MFPKSKSLMSSSSGLFKPKNPHSLDHLKYLYGILCKNQSVTENNLGLLVETLRSISEILIWGDQNDSTVFDFFLEKNMLVFFLKFMRQKSGQCICVQLLQTLNILFDNITNETSVYYLLSNNHINSIIIHKFDFSDEEVMAYYISFLKTLSMKLNKHTVHFFYNEHTNDFALYTEAIKFFNHSESMVRIAVRTITLNVYRACVPLSRISSNSDQCLAEDRNMLQYIKEKTASPYFINLVKFISNHVVELHNCVKQDTDHNSKCRLSDLIAEHLDHLHYLNDILCLYIDALNEVLTEHLLNQLFIPLYVHSLLLGADADLCTAAADDEAMNKMEAACSSSQDNCIVSLFLLSQVFLIIHHSPLVSEMVRIIFMRDDDDGSMRESEMLKEKHDDVENVEMSVYSTSTTEQDHNTMTTILTTNHDTNSTDEEKLMRSISNSTTLFNQHLSALKVPGRPYLTMIFTSLDCTRDDYQALLALCLLYALKHNSGVNQEMLDSVQIPRHNSKVESFNIVIIQQLINIMSLSCQNGSKIRLATLELSIVLLKVMCCRDGLMRLEDEYVAAIEGVREGSTLMLRNFYKVWQKSEEIFLDMFEDEHRELTTHPLNVDHLMMDACILLPPIGTPLTGIDFCKRLPCGEVERARRAIRLFFLMRDLSYHLRQETDTSLPLTKDNECVHVDDVLDLNNSDLIACTVIHSENKKERRFLVIDTLQLILVEPDSKKLGWGLVRFVGFLQDTEVTSDKEDSRCLQVTIHKPSSNPNARIRPLPILSAKFLFDDHIRCMAARQRLTKGRLKARQKKMQMIAKVLDMPAHLVDSLYIASTASSITRLNIASSSSSSPSLLGSSSPLFPGQAHRRKTKEVETDSTSSSNVNNKSPSIKQSIFASVDKVPAFNVVATEQEHERRARRLKAKLTDSINRQQQLAKTLLSSSNANHHSNVPTSTPENKKKMFLSMAKEAKQRSMQQNKKVDQQQCASDTRENTTTPTNQHEGVVMGGGNTNNEVEKNCLRESVSSSSALSRIQQGDLRVPSKVGSLDSKIEMRCVASSPLIKNMTRASSETRYARVRDDERRNSGPSSNFFLLSRNTKEAFTSWINPLINRSTATQPTSTGQTTTQELSITEQVDDDN